MSEVSLCRPAGYANLTARLGLETIPNWHVSWVGIGSSQRTETDGATATTTYPPSYWPGDSLGAHLEFALKYDGVNLGILAAVFANADAAEIVSYVASKPLGKYARRTWFLYEFLTGKTLPLQDLSSGNYVDLLDEEQYYAVSPAPQVRRQRVNNNLLGDHRFCPTIRRTIRLREYEAMDLRSHCQKVVANYSPQMLRRAMTYLYSRETKSSFEIEHVRPGPTRTERFIALLQLADREDFCIKERLVELQNRTVDPRFAQAEYRDFQNYIGESLAWQRERVHYACPKPEQVPELMAGLLESHRVIERAGVSPVIAAAAIAYGFVFVHPFEDGNGRIHRFLIHNILARRSFSPPSLVLPVSAAMLKDLVDYDASLEAFSKPLMRLVDYDLDDEGRMTVRNDCAASYAYIDLTAQAEALYQFVEHTITRELVEELNFLENYDRTKAAIQRIIDMPDRKIDLFISVCLQNNGRLSARKRTSHFAMLTEDEILRMEQAVRASYQTASAAAVKGEGERHGL